jgi:hypothetical protein
MSMRWRLLLVVPLVALLIGPLYAGRRPDFLGVAFFYWYELAATLVSIAIAFIVCPTEQAQTSRPLRQTYFDDGPRFSRDPSIRLRPRDRTRV